MMDRLNEIRARHNADTPGPYLWIMRSKTHQCELVTAHSGQYYVMDFTRWGMQDACPRFQVYDKYEGEVKERGSHGMERADNLAKPIGGLAYRIGNEEYIDHPDAIALEKSWDDIDALLTEVFALTARAEKAEAERDACKAALQNWHEDSHPEEAENRWIPVSERLPDKQQWCHIAIKYKRGIRVEQDLYAIETAEQFGHEHGFCKRNTGEITHCHPFPEPPTEETHHE